MSTLKCLPRGALLIAVLALLAGCSGDEGPSGPTGSKDFDSAIAVGGEFAPVEEVYDVSSETVAEVVGDETFFCTTTSYNVVEAPDNFPLFNPNADIIWPGNLLQGATLGQATPNPIPVRRGPGTVVMTILNGSEELSRYLPEVTLAGVFGAMNDIIANASNTVPANFTFSAEEVHCWEHMALYLDVTVQYLTASLGTSLSFSTDHEYNRFVVKLNQSYFSMAFQTPTSTAEFFHPSETAEHLANYIQPGNPPTFVSLVTYGRIFYLLIESTASSLDMRASIDASFSAGCAGGSMGAGAAYVNELENVKIKAFALGGDSGDALSAITSDFEALKGYLASGGDIDTGVPLSYVARSLAHPDRIVNVAVAADYDVTTCVPVGESFKNPIFLYKAGKDSDQDPAVIELTGDSPQHVTRWNNLLYYDEDDRDATPVSPYTSAGTFDSDAVNGHEAITFAAAAGDVGGALTYPAVDFADSSFTIVAVARLVSTQGNYPAYFMFGTSGQSGRNLKVGFSDDSHLVVTTGNQTLEAEAGVSLTDFNVFTFRFSREEGMAIYVNGDNAPAAADPTLTAPLLSYAGARIGSSSGVSIQIAEIKAYGIAFHEAQREFVTEAMMVKYGI